MYITKKQRFIGFDLARAYAIFGMFVVNFNTAFGSLNDNSFLGKFLNSFNGNSSTAFVILAGMGVALMTDRAQYTGQEKSKLKSIVIKRAGFLFAIGILLCLWWPADILHFYGCYMVIAALLLFLPKRFYLWAAFIVIVIFHLILLVFPYETGWNFDTLEYTDFWTINGFIRNTFYNGWNSVFPWVAYFLLGMWLGRHNWAEINTQKKMFFYGAIIFVVTECLQIYASLAAIDKGLQFYITADYIPPFLPFMISTSGFALMLISACMLIGNKVADRKIAKLFAATGQMTLTHYVSHLTIGILLFAILSGKQYTGHITNQVASSPAFILLFSILYFIFSFVFSAYWTTKHKNGPLETIMRKISLPQLGGLGKRNG